MKIRILWFLPLILLGCAENTDAPADEEVCFTRDVRPVVDVGCAKSGCHDSATRAADITLITYSDIAAVADDITDRIVKPSQNGGMPPSPWVKLSEAQILKIKKWVEQGRKNTTCDSLPLPDSSSITYTKHIAPIINLYCIGCHYEKGGFGGPRLTTYEEVKEEVEFGNLIASIQRKAGYVPMPPGRTRMTSRDIRIVEMWRGNFSE